MPRECRFGGAARGNVMRGSIKNLLTSVAGVDTNAVTNLRTAVGGREEESLDDAKIRVPRAIRSRCRAVTADDFEYLAMQAANIKRALALPLTHPGFPGVKVPGVVTVVVVPDSEAPNPIPSEGTLRSVCAYLNQARMLTTELYVVRPTYHQVRVTAEIVAENTADLLEVKTTVEQALLDYFHPLRGGESGDGWPFGGDIYFSRVYQRVSVRGAQRIERMVISVDGCEAPDCTNIPVCDGDLLYSVDHDVTVTYDFGG
ncbi:MAG TPA: baseplate J/gp47 family protein [Usitatibacter sp.]